MAPFLVSVGMLLCIAAYARPAREHDSLIFMYFVPILAVSCFVCAIVRAADVCAREVGGGGMWRVCRVTRDRSVETWKR